MKHYTLTNNTSGPVEVQLIGTENIRLAGYESRPISLTDEELDKQLLGHLNDVLSTKICTLHLAAEAKAPENSSSADSEGNATEENIPATEPAPELGTPDLPQVAVGEPGTDTETFSLGEPSQAPDLTSAPSEDAPVEEKPGKAKRTK